MTVLFDWLAENWQTCTSAVTMLVVVWAYLNARILWRKRDFTHRVNFSLNYIDDGVLKIRTLMETDMDTVLLHNAHGKRLLVKHMKQTSLDRPFIHLPPDERWVILNAVLNELSERFAEGFLAASMGVSNPPTRYVLGLSCERDAQVRLNKVRVMVIEKSLLQRIDRFDELRFESEHHSVRWKTLKRMKQLVNDPEHQAAFLQIELSIPA